MSFNPIQRLGQGADKWLKGKFNAVQASNEAGAKWINKGGMLSDRITAISEMTFDENIPTEVDAFISLQSQTFEAAIPYLQAKDDPRTFKKIKNYLRSYSMFTNAKKRLDYNKKMRELILEEMAYYPESFKGLKPELAGRFEEVLKEEETYETDEAGFEEETPTSRDNQKTREMRINFLIEQLPIDLQAKISRYAVDSLELKVQQCRTDMLRYSKLLIALSFGAKDVEPSPPIVIIKPESPPPRTMMPPNVRDSRPLAELQQQLQQLEYYRARQQQED